MQDAQDLTQDFFAKILEHNWLDTPTLIAVASVRSCSSRSKIFSLMPPRKLKPGNAVAL
jgi:hypothetical protein